METDVKSISLYASLDNWLLKKGVINPDREDDVIANKTSQNKKVKKRKKAKMKLNIVQNLFSNSCGSPTFKMSKSTAKNKGVHNISDMHKENDIADNNKNSNLRENVKKNIKQPTLSKCRKNVKHNLCTEKPRQVILESFITKIEPKILQSSLKESCDSATFEISKSTGKNTCVFSHISTMHKEQEESVCNTTSNKNKKADMHTKKQTLSKCRRKNIKQNLCTNDPRKLKLESFVCKIQSDVNTSSDESCDLPTFNIKKPTAKTNKLYKKYGVIIPTVGEILQEQKELEVYKNQIESLLGLNDLCLESLLPMKVSEKESDQCTQVLDCKHLTLKEISNGVKNNLTYLIDIMNGRVFNRRHELFYDKHIKPYNLSTTDLTYNTSVVLFSFEQTEYILTKLRKYLDPEDKLTQYFFQVLLPEVCLKIFIDNHDMSYEEAVTYLDTRPIEN